METITHLLLGSNLGDRAENLKKARELLRETVGEILKISTIYETEPWKMDEANWFLNQVILLNTSMSLQTLIFSTKSIETQMGRTSSLHEGLYESRMIDIDILYKGSIIHNEPGLIVPHPRLHMRKFTLIPLCEITPDFIHPVFLKTQLEILEECTDIGITKAYLE